jgi:hypothetical protein
MHVPRQDGDQRGAGTAYHFGSLEFTTGFSEVARSVVFCVVFCLSFCKLNTKTTESKDKKSLKTPKRVIKSLKQKDRQYNGQKIKDKRINNNLQTEGQTIQWPTCRYEEFNVIFSN